MKVFATLLSTLFLLLGLALPGARAAGWHLAAATLTAAPSSLAGFTTAQGTPSAQQATTVNGSDLTGDVTATASSGYEVSWTQGAFFDTSVTLTAPGGVASNVPLYVRLKGTALGPLSGTIIIASAGAASQTVTLSGTVTAAPTPNPAATVTSSTPASGLGGATVEVHVYGQNFVPGASLSLQATGKTYVATYVSSTHIMALVTLPSVSTKTDTYFRAGNPAPGGGDTNNKLLLFSITPGPPTITRFSPASGPVGTQVTLYGTNLGNPTSIRLNGTSTSLAFTPNSTNITVDVPVGATTGFFTVTTPDGAAVSPTQFVVTSSVYEDFERGTKNSYAAASEMLQSGGWTFREALIGTTAGADKFNGAKGARLRGGGSIEMDTDKPGGAGVVTVSAATYGTETGVSFVPEISTDGGLTYSSLLGSNAPPTLTGTLTAYSFTANRGGNVRLRFSTTNTAATTNPRLSLDDVFIANYTALATTPAGQLPNVQVFPNPARDQVTVAGTGPAGARVSLLNALGQLVLPPAAVADGQALPLPATLPAGLYLLRVQTPAGQRAERLVKE